MFHRIAILRLFVISQENTLKHLFTLFGTTSFQNTSGRQHLNRSDNLNKDILTPLLVTSHSKSMSLAKRHLLTFPPPCRTLSFIILSGTKTLVCNFQKKQRRIGNIDLVKRLICSLIFCHLNICTFVNLPDLFSIFVLPFSMFLWKPFLHLIFWKFIVWLFHLTTNHFFYCQSFFVQVSSEVFYKFIKFPAVSAFLK